MTTDAPSRIGTYAVEREVGRGGMGVVYLARDPRLDRPVAIKVLPDAFATDPERLARFEREAKILASLHHPNIAGIHSIEEADGRRFLTLEYVEGQTLAERIGGHPLRIEEALELCRQIAAALEAAHESGVIHRDLKPANVKLTADGQVKVLDFGLAKALEDETGATSSSSMSHSPTLTSPMTAANVILGTAAYMSPEQARGKSVDRRADIWAFGCVLYECLTARRAFVGETVSDTIAKILEREPDWSALPARIPPKVRELLRRCLEKDSRKRLRDIGDARLELDEVLAEGVSASGIAWAAGGVAQPVARWSGSTMLAWGVAAVAIAIAAGAFMFPKPWRASARPVATRSTIPSPAGMRISNIPADAAISPDGKMLVFAASDSVGKSRLWLRSLESLEARPIAGTEFTGDESPGLPFWSPDSKSIGFFADDRLKTIPITGGSPQVLCKASNARGGTWNRQGVILFAPSSQGPLFRVSQSGGEPTQVTFLDSTRHENAHRFPRFLPDGRHFHFVVLPGQEGKVDTWVGELGSNRRTLLVSASSGAVFASPGYLVFVRDQSLVAQPLDLSRLRLRGEPVGIGEAPDLGTLGTNPASASEKGIMVFPTNASTSSRLMWFGRDGRAQGGLPVPEGDYPEIVLSPDSKQIALMRRISSTSIDLWIADASSGAMTRLTTDGNTKYAIQWSGDGSRIAYSVVRGNEVSFCERAVTGSEDERILFTSKSVFKGLSQVTPDGSYLVFDDLERTTQRDLWVVPLKGDRKPIPFLRTPFNETGGAISPDGRWMLYQSDESGRVEVYVQSFPTPGKRARISTDRGFGAVWRGDGAEILYGSQKGIMSVTVRGGSPFEASEPKLLMAVPKEWVTMNGTWQFDRFLAALSTGDAPRVSLTLLTNWTSLLEH